MQPRPATSVPVQRLRLVIADDHGILRAGIAYLLEHCAGVEVVGQAGNGCEAVEAWRRHRPDITLMDLRMPVMGGLAALQQIRAMQADAAVVILTTSDGDEDIYCGMRAGARGYILKDATTEELVDCIRCVGAGRTYLPAALCSKLAARMNVDTLTSREREILGRVANGEANKMIAYHLDIATGTVKTHLASILSKLNVSSRTGAVAIARRRGLID